MNDNTVRRGRLWCAVAVLLIGGTAALAVDPDPLPFPVYVACRLDGEITVDGKLAEPAWRQTSLGWGTSHAIEPNLLCPDPTLFRIAHDPRHLHIALACYKRKIQDDLPEHIWRPRETDMMDVQAVPRHARERGVIPPINTADVLISREGRTVTIHFAPPEPPTAVAHDAVGDHQLQPDLRHAYGGGPDDDLWTVELQVAWDQIGFPPPAAGDDWALNVYRDIRFFSNWSYIAWMRQWEKTEYSRFDLTERFGRLWFVDRPAQEDVERRASDLSQKRGPVRVFLPDMLLVVEEPARLVRQRYADRLKVLRAYANELFTERNRIGNDLPMYPFYPEKERRPHLAPAARKLNELSAALSQPPLWDDPAASVALISHAIPEARQGLAAWKNERLYRGLPE